jgi:hypothetical protein
MSNLDQPEISVANRIDDAEELEAENSATIQHAPNSPNSIAKASRAPWLVPTLLGVILLAVALFLPLRSRFNWAYRPGSWLETANFILVITGILIGLLLLALPSVLRRVQQTGEPPRLSATLVLPVVLWLVGMSAVALTFALTANRYPEPPVKSCVELYADAAAVADKNPAFRLSPENPDERRCGINQAVFG